MPETEIMLNYGDGNNLIINSQSCCIIGPNGSGKSSLAKELKNKNLGKPIEVIVAQKNLIVQQGRMKGVIDEELKEKKSQYRIVNLAKNETNNGWDKLKTGVLNNNLNNIMQDDFNSCIELLNRDFYSLHAKASYTRSEPPITKFEKIKQIWDGIFLKHLEYDFDNFKFIIGGNDYEIENLSDGEKCALYYLVKCSFAPENSIIIIDECETYLNQALLGELRDNIENLRRDCKFIYISHDIDFVTSRINSKKYWIKSFTFPSEWEIEEIQTYELPEELIVQIIGSKKEKILFVESSNDAKLYSKIYPDFKIISVDNCHNVVAFTKALNQIGGGYGKLYFGLIDKDFRSLDEIRVLQENKIYTLPVAEYEEIFFKENIVRFVLSYLGSPDIDEKIQNLKSSVLELKDNAEFKEDFYKNKVQAKLNQMFANFSIDNLTFSVDKNSLDSEWNQIYSITDYDEFLSVVNTKAIKNKVGNLGYNRNQFYNTVLNLFNTERADDFRAVFMAFMPNIE